MLAKDICLILVRRTIRSPSRITASCSSMHRGWSRRIIFVMNRRNHLKIGPGYQGARSSLLSAWLKVRHMYFCFISGLDWLIPEANPRPRILFSHIPLSRSSGANCGPLRERGSIQRGAGMGYQNLLGRHTTQFLLDSIKPIIIFRCVLLGSSQYFNF